MSYIYPSSVRVCVVTWNMHGRLIDPDVDLVPILLQNQRPDIYIIGTQECEQSIQRALLSFDVSKQAWLNLLKDTFGSAYVLKASQVLSVCCHDDGIDVQSMHVACFVHREVATWVTNIQTAYTIVGAGNVVANKGAVGLSFTLGSCSFLFINSHLPASQDGTALRNKAYNRIVNTMSFTQVVPVIQQPAAPVIPRNPKRAWVVESPVKNTDSPSRPVTAVVHDAAEDNTPWRDGLDDDDDIFLEADDVPCAQYPVYLDFDFVVWLGDLNYRVNGNRDVVGKLVNDGAVDVLLSNDQLLQQRREGTVFRNWAEGLIMFPPTYKYDSDTSDYDTSKKNRVPAYTDRVLYRDNGRFTVEARRKAYNLERKLHPKVYAAIPTVLDTYTGPVDAPFPHGDVSLDSMMAKYNAIPKHWRVKLQRYSAIQDVTFSDHKPVVCDLEFCISAPGDDEDDVTEVNHVVRGCCVAM